MEYKICPNCVMDSTDPNIKFEPNGKCSRCNQYHDQILPWWNKGKGHEKELNYIINKIKQKGKEKPYDCLLGLSGGFDSSYMLHMAVKEWELRPLVFHVDAGFNLPVAENNIKKIVDKLNIDLKIKKINWNEIRDFQLAYFKSGVPHLDTPQDLAFVSALDEYAKNNNIKYILDGKNISTEVIVNPNAWSYWATDSRHNKDIIKKFGTVQMKEYPFTNIFKRKVYMKYIKGVEVLKLLNYIPYIKKYAEALLINEYGYVPYPQKHFEDILTKFLEGYWLPKRFGFDIRKAQYSSLILTKQMTREEALEKLKHPPLSEEKCKKLFEEISSILEISSEELNKYFIMPLRSYKDYKNSEWMFNYGAVLLRILGSDKLIRK